MPETRPSLPSCKGAFLATDIAGSTALGRQLGETAFADVLHYHHRILRQEFVRAGGTEFKETGDGFWVIFPDARAALTCACACQEALARPTDENPDEVLRVRMAIHVGEAQLEDGDYHGLILHDASRVLSAANGGQLLVSEATEAELRHRLPISTTLVNKGRFLLRDAPTPQHLYEVVWDAMPMRDLPAPNAPWEHTPLLPPTFTRFIGRETEITQISALLQETDTRVVSLTGMGGTGKTRLALEVARILAGVFSGAVWFVSLVDLKDPTRILPAVRDAIEADRNGDAWDAIVEILTPQPGLLVLDNLEHLLPDDDMPGDAYAFVYELLNRCPKLSCITTSRQRLGLSLEAEFPLKPLPIPGDAPGKDLLKYDCVALFQDRASRVRPDFRITVQNAQTIATLCNQLEGIPLGVELAAAWTRLLTPQEMLAEFTQIRQSRNRDLPTRHRSLTAVVEGSYQLLNADQQRFFRRLSVFRGGFTRAEARVICVDPTAMSLLADLQDRSLLLVEEEGDVSRYGLLETLREFAEARLAEDATEQSQTQARHTAYFADLVAEAEPELKGAEQARWLERLTVEHQNLRMALAQASQTRRWQMASQLHRYFMVRGHIAEGRDWLHDVLSADAEDATVRAKALNIAGALALSAGDLTKAHAYFTEGIQQSRALGDELGTALCLINRAIIASQQGELTAARQEYEQSLPLWRHLDRPGTLAVVLSNLGAITIQQHDHSAARVYLEESLRVQGDKGDPLLRANTLHNLAENAVDVDDFFSALRYLRDCLDIRLALNDKSAVVNLMCLIATIKSRTGCPKDAAVLYAAADAASVVLQTAFSALTRTEVDARIDEVRRQLGDGDFQNAWEEGKALSWSSLITRVESSIQSTTLNATA